MATFDYDLFTIGAGSGGVAASRRAAVAGARVGICESSRVGGTCVIRGCVPKKLLMYAGQFRDAFEDAGAFGWSVDGTRFDWPTLIANKDAEIDRLNGIYLGMLSNAHVDLYEGRGRVVDPHTVEVDGRRFTARRILIATGARPWRPEFPGSDLAITSDEAFHLETLPRRVIVLGAGYIACEFASIFNALGSEVTQVYRGDQILRGFDRTIRDTLAEEMQARGVEIVTGRSPVDLRQERGGFILTDDAGTVREAEVVMTATGRTPNTAGLGLEDVGVALGSNGEVPVDAYSQTCVESIYAIGDVTDRVNLTPVAIAEGRALVRTLFQDAPTAVDHALVPKAVFAMPPAASVGLTEEEARAAGHAVRIFQARFRPMRYTMPDRQSRALMKMVVDRDSDRVLGVHMVGEDGPEILQALAVAMTAGATKADFDRTLALHPTTAEEFVLMYEPVEG